MSTEAGDVHYFFARGRKMEDLSHWDMANTFTPVEAAALINGVEPDGIDTGNSRIKPTLKRLEMCYRDAMLYYKGTYDRTKECVVGFQTPFNQIIQSVEMTTWTSQDPVSDFSLRSWMNDTDRSAFKRQIFSRVELTRWLSEIGVESKYLFVKTMPNGGEVSQTDTSGELSEINSTKALALMAWLLSQNKSAMQIGGRPNSAQIGVAVADLAKNAFGQDVRGFNSFNKKISTALKLLEAENDGVDPFKSN